MFAIRNSDICLVISAQDLDSAQDYDYKEATIKGEEAEDEEDKI